MADSNLDKLSARGQSVWIDYLSRDLLEQGELKRMMDEDAVVGVTTNPTIFQKAIAEGDAYDEQLKELLETESDPKEIFLELSARDVDAATDLLAPVHEENAQDGYVSWEVDPTLAYDREGTFDGSPPEATSRSSPRRYASTTSAYRCSEKISVTLMLFPCAMQSSIAPRPGFVAGIFT